MVMSWTVVLDVAVRLGPIDDVIAARWNQSGDQVSSSSPTPAPMSRDWLGPYVVCLPVQLVVRVRCGRLMPLAKPPPLKDARHPWPTVQTWAGVPVRPTGNTARAGGRHGCRHHGLQQDVRPGPSRQTGIRPSCGPHRGCVIPRHADR